MKGGFIQALFLYSLFLFLIFPINIIAATEQNEREWLNSFLNPPGIDINSLTIEKRFDYLKSGLTHTNRNYGKNSYSSILVSYLMAKLYEEKGDYDSAITSINPDFELELNNENFGGLLDIKLQYLRLLAYKENYLSIAQQLKIIGKAFKIHDEIHMELVEGIFGEIVDPEHELHDLIYMRDYLAELVFSDQVKGWNKSIIHRNYINILELFFSDDKRLIANELYDLAEFYSKQGSRNINKKIFYLNKSLNIRLENQLDMVGQILGELGVAYLEAELPMHSDIIVDDLIRLVEIGSQVDDQSNIIKALFKNLISNIDKERIVQYIWLNNYLLQLLERTNETDVLITLINGFGKTIKTYNKKMYFDSSKDIYSKLKDFAFNQENFDQNSNQFIAILYVLVTAFDVENEVDYIFFDDKLTHLKSKIPHDDQMLSMMSVLTVSEILWELQKIDISLKLLELYSEEYISIDILMDIGGGKNKWQYISSRRDITKKIYSALLKISEPKVLNLFVQKIINDQIFTSESNAFRRLMIMNSKLIVELLNLGFNKQVENVLIHQNSLSLVYKFKLNLEEEFGHIVDNKLLYSLCTGNYADASKITKQLINGFTKTLTDSKIDEGKSKKAHASITSKEDYYESINEDLEIGELANMLDRILFFASSLELKRGNYSLAASYLEPFFSDLDNYTPYYQVFDQVLKYAHLNYLLGNLDKSISILERFISYLKNKSTEGEFFHLGNIEIGFDIYKIKISLAVILINYGDTKKAMELVKELTKTYYSNTKTIYYQEDHNMYSGIEIVLAKMHYLLNDFDSAYDLLNRNTEIKFQNNNLVLDMVSNSAIRFDTIPYFGFSLQDKRYDWVLMLLFGDNNLKFNQNLYLDAYLKVLHKKFSKQNSKPNSDVLNKIIATIHSKHSTPLKALVRQARIRSNKNYKIKQLYRQLNSLDNQIESLSKWEPIVSYDQDGNKDGRFSLLNLFTSFREWNCNGLFTDSLNFSNDKDLKKYTKRKERKSARVERTKILTDLRELEGQESKKLTSQSEKEANLHSQQIKEIKDKKFQKLDNFSPNLDDVTSFLRASIHDDQAVIIFTVIKNSIFTYIMTNNSSHDEFFILNQNYDEIENSVNKIRTGLVNDNDNFKVLDYDSDEYWEWVNELKDLYETIIHPIEDILHSKKHLIIFPDGILRSLPFGILVKEIIYKKIYDENYPIKQIWLADLFETSVIVDFASLLGKPYSSEQLDFYDETVVLNFQDLVKDPKEFLGLGSPVLEGDLKFNTCSRGSDHAISILRSISFDDKLNKEGIERLKSLCPLPGSELEINEISNLFTKNLTKTFTNENFTEKSFKQLAYKVTEDGYNELSKFKYISFATHALLATETAEMGFSTEPALVFTPDPNSYEDGNEGLLTMSEILNLDINAELVTLSACNTASGSGANTNLGLSGLASAFSYAGAKNLLVSHWPVSDRSTSIFMQKLYKTLIEDPSIQLSTALKATRDHLKSNPEYSHPYFWGPFDLFSIGNMQ